MEAGAVGAAGAGATAAVAVGAAATAVMVAAPAAPAAMPVRQRKMPGSVAGLAEGLDLDLGSGRHRRRANGVEMKTIREGRLRRSMQAHRHTDNWLRHSRRCSRSTGVRPCRRTRHCTRASDRAQTCDRLVVSRRRLARVRRGRRNSRGRRVRDHAWLRGQLINRPGVLDR